MLPKKIQSQINRLPMAIQVLVEAVIVFFKGLLAGKEKEISTLKRKLKEAEDKLAKNSSNSSKPPSSDGLQKPEPKSGRPRDKNKKPGGQKGHEGTTLEMVEAPDYTVLHEVSSCRGCGKDLSNLPALDHRRRQVFDIPPIQVRVTEHQAQMKVCTCGCMTIADFPRGVDHPVQYGGRIKGFVTYAQSYQLLPYDRTKEFVADLFGHHLSTGTLNNVNQKAYDHLEDFEKRLKHLLTLCAVAGFDETGFRVMSKLHWLHSCSTDEYAYYEVSGKRGHEAMDAIGILPAFEGIAVHDFWSSYYRYSCEHSLCNAHLLRELIFLYERMGQDWALEMHDLLVRMNKAKKRAVQGSKQGFSQATLSKYQKEYDQIVANGLNLNPFKPPDPDQKKRGRPAKGKVRNLLERLEDKVQDILRFFYDFKVPFDNNFSERDLRMMKVKQKVSGCFRSFSGAQRFARIRSYIVTARKQNINVLDALNDLFEEQNIPFVLTADYQG